MRELFEFGAFRVDTVERVLLREGQPVPVTQKVFELLVILVQNHGHVVEKEKLMKEIWPGTFVEEGNLTQNISLLRKALQDDGHDYIQTVPRRGYRFVGDVRERFAESELVIEEHSLARVVVEEPGLGSPGTSKFPDALPTPTPLKTSLSNNPRTWILIAAPIVAVAIIITYLAFVRPFRNSNVTAATEPRSIAVLPFQNMTATSGDEFLGLGMTDALISRLSNIRRANIRPTSAVQKYAGGQKDAVTAGKELRVDAVLAGTLQKEGDRIRVSVQLIDVKQGKTIWARAFDEKLTNIFAVEDAISEQIAQAVTPRLTADERVRVAKHYTDDPAAHELYLQGRFYLNKFTEDGTKLARRYFEQAIARDPHYALAHAGLAESFAFGEIGLPPEEAFPKARESATKAIELDDSVGQAHAALGQVAFLWDWNWNAAEKEFKRALDLTPADPEIHHMYAHYLSAMGRFDEALVESQRLLELDPLSPASRNHLGWHYLYAHQFDLAIEQYKSVIAIDPNFAEAHRQLAEAYAEKGRFDEAVAEMARRFELIGRSDESLTLRKAYASGGWKVVWQKRLELIQQRSKTSYMSPSGTAYIYAELGDITRALDYLEEAYREHDHGLVYMKVDYTWDPLRSEPRFQELLKRMRLS